MGACGAGRNHVKTFALQPELDGNIARRHIADHKRYQQRVHTAGSLFQKLLHILFHGLEGTDSRTHAHTHAVGIFLLHVNARMLQGLL